MFQTDPFTLLTIAWLSLPPVVFVLLMFVRAPYGRYTNKQFGPLIDRRLGWIIMEAPSAIIVALCFAMAPTHSLVSVVLLCMWEVHYVHRSFIFPFRMRGGQKNMTVLASGLGFFFNLGNGFVNGYFVFWLASHLDDSWLSDPRLWVGLILFLVGLTINKWSDKILINLRKPGESGYSIPRGGLYRFVSCPNYFGEILEWSGWAIATFSLPGLAFALFTMANLVPRAIAHHRWYQEKFPDYPTNRKAVFPFVL